AAGPEAGRGTSVRLLVAAVGSRVAGLEVGRAGRVEVQRRVLEAQAELGQLLLDLGAPLRTAVAAVQQVRLAGGHALAHLVDALALEAVVRTDGGVELLDRQRQVRGARGVRRRRADLDALGLDVQLTCQAEQLDQGLAGRGERVARRDRL